MKRKRNLLIITALVVFTVLRGRYGLCVTRYDIHSPAVPEAFDGFRIVQVSDLHGAEFGRNNSRLAAVIASERPDMIAITGDAASDMSELPAFCSLLSQISELAPVYYVSGNHEWAGGIMPQVLAAVDEAGAKALKNEYYELTRGGDGIVIAGVDDPNGRADMIKPDELALNIRQTQGDEFTVLLGHRNYWQEQYPALPVDLILCGHAHGGIIRLPIIGGLINTDRTFPARYEGGAYTGGDYTMVVSRGLGSTGPVPRIFNCPEVVTVVLHSE